LILLLITLYGGEILIIELIGKPYLNLPPWEFRYSHYQKLEHLSPWFTQTTKDLGSVVEEQILVCHSSSSYFL